MIDLIVNYLHRKYGVALHNFFENWTRGMNVMTFANSMHCTLFHKLDEQWYVLLFFAALTWWIHRITMGLCYTDNWFRFAITLYIRNRNVYHWMILSTLFGHQSDPCKWPLNFRVHFDISYDDGSQTRNTLLYDRHDIYLTFHQSWSEPSITLTRHPALKRWNIKSVLLRCIHHF